MRCFYILNVHAVGQLQPWTAIASSSGVTAASSTGGRWGNYMGDVLVSESYRLLFICLSSFCLYVCLGVCLSVRLFACPFVCLSVYLSECRYVCLPPWLCVCLSVCLCMSVCLSVCLSLYVCLSVCQCMSVCLSVCLFVSQSICN